MLKNANTCCATNGDGTESTGDVTLREGAADSVTPKGQSPPVTVKPTSPAIVQRQNQAPPRRIRAQKELPVTENEQQSGEESGTGSVSLV